MQKKNMSEGFLTYLFASFDHWLKRKGEVYFCGYQLLFVTSTRKYPAAKNDSKIQTHTTYGNV